MTDATTPTVRRSPLWMRVLLGVSLALNLAVIGLAAGAALRLFGHGGPPLPPESFGGAIYRALEPGDRRELSARVRATVEPRNSRREDAASLVRALRAEPYDAAAVVAVLDAQSAARLGWREALQVAWLDQVASMNASERKAYADRVEAEEQRRLRDRHKKKDRRQDHDRD